MVAMLLRRDAHTIPKVKDLFAFELWATMLIRLAPFLPLVNKHVIARWPGCKHLPGVVATSKELFATDTFPAMNGLNSEMNTFFNQYFLQKKAA